MQNTTKKRNAKNIVLALSLIAVLAIGGAAAYFTDTDTVTNVFTVGKVTVELTEPEYDKHPDDHQDITPNKTIDKDPLVKNTGINDAYVFIDVTIPKATVKTAELNGAQKAAQNQELFDYVVNDGWTQVVKEDSTTECRYVFAYAKNGACTALTANEVAPVFFKNGKVRFINVIEGQGLEEDSLEIPVQVLAIQTKDINGGKTAPADVWSVLETQVSTGTN